MITIKIFGVDPYLLRNISKDATKKIADLYEISADEVNFLAPECLYVHNGIEQNTWNILVEVHAPKKVSVLEEDAFKIIKQYLKDVAINIECIFYYFSSDNYHYSFNTDYPRFMSEENLVNVDYDETDDYYEEEDDDECECEHCRHDHDDGDEEEPSEDDLYLGNAFEGFEDKINKKN